MKKGCCENVGFIEHRKIVCDLLLQIAVVMSSLLSYPDDREKLNALLFVLGLPREYGTVQRPFLFPIYRLIITMNKHEAELESISEFLKEFINMYYHMSVFIFYFF